MHARPPWQTPPDTLALSDDAVHVWRAPLDILPGEVSAFHGTLSAEERSRAERFRFPRDRARFIVARGVLRAILGRYLHEEPDTIGFAYSASGKPSLREGDAIQFNVSHAAGVALYAVTRAGAVGVDIEAVRADMASERIAERFFSPREVAALRALAPHHRPDAFFRCWTRKEAYVKARGTGIGAALDAFDVSLGPDEPAAVLAIRDAHDARRWSMHHLSPGVGYVGAVAVAGGASALACWQWQARFGPRDERFGGMRDVRAHA